MRKHWMDNLRWVTVILVLIYHVFYFYNNKGVFGGIGGFEEDPMGQRQDAVMYLLYPWFMMLLFLLAGIGSRYSLQKRSVLEFINSRTLKLLVPSTIGLLVFHWMTGYFNTHIAGVDVLASVSQPAKFFLWAFSGIGPLWFIQDLWLFSLLLLLIPRKDGIHAWCGNIGRLGVFFLGVLIFLGAQTLIMHPRPESADGLYNLYKPVFYFIPFLMGYFVFSHEKVQDDLAKYHMPLLILALLSGAALLKTTFGQNNTDPIYLRGWLNNLYAWLMTLAMLGLFKARFDFTGKFAAYMTGSSFGIYVVHYLVIASLGYMMKVYTSLPPFAMYAILFVAVLFLSPLIYEILHRIPFIRWCVFGEKKKQT